MVIDDDVDIVRILKEHLENEGYSVLPGYDGQMALNLLKMRRPHLLILDIQMPMTNGLKVLEFMRKAEETRGIPVILLSGAQSQGVYQVVDSLPRVAFIKKPLDIENINSLVCQYLQQYPLPA
jgi:CheY-like chemotaxis protein